MGLNNLVSFTANIQEFIMVQFIIWKLAKRINALVAQLELKLSKIELLKMQFFITTF